MRQSTKIVLFLNLCNIFHEISSKGLLERQKREVSTLIICDRGEFTAQCKYGTTIYINSAIFGRWSPSSICGKGGLQQNKLCQSKTALESIKEACRGKSLCKMEVNGDTLGYPVTNLEETCMDTSVYLELKYSCEKDCNPPYVDFNVQIIGNYHIGSTVTLICRDGYESYNGAGTADKTCLDDGSWNGGSILCKDINECMLRSTNRCHKNAKCTNTRGSYSCQCLENYSGDGYSCTSDSWFDVPLNGFGNKTFQDYQWDEVNLDVHDEEQCGSRVLRLRRGTIRSPSFPRFYPSDSSCTWALIAPPGLVLELVFTKFQLENEKQNAGCGHDNVTVYDGLSKNALRWIGTYCGDSIPPKILSNTNQLRVEFRADSVGNFPGFEAKFSARNIDNECQNFGAHFYTGVIVVNGHRNETTKPGENVTLSCDHGYRRTSLDLVRHCLDDGRWNNIENPCTAITCGEPPLASGKEGLIIDGTPEQFAYGKDPVRYACKSGYRLRLVTGTDGLIYCDKRGEWSNAYEAVTPTCERLQCEVTEKEVPVNEYVSWEVSNGGERIPYQVGMKLQYGSEIRYSCNSGYSLVSEKVRRCGNEGWSGRNVHCEEDNGILGLTNLQIAIIAASISAAIIIVVGVGLVMCCIRSKNKKRRVKNSYQRRMRGARENNGFIMNYSGPPQQGTDRSSRGSFAGRHNNLSAYSTPPPNFMQAQSIPEHDEFYNHAIAPRTNLEQQMMPIDRPRTNETFLAHNEIRPPQPTGYVDPVHHRSGTLPMPKGYADPPPSYDTMLKSSKSKTKSPSKSSKKRRKSKY